VCTLLHKLAAASYSSKEREGLKREVKQQDVSSSSDDDDNDNDDDVQEEEDYDACVCDPVKKKSTSSISDQEEEMTMLAIKLSKEEQVKRIESASPHEKIKPIQHVFVQFRAPPRRRLGLKVEAASPTTRASPASRLYDTTLDSAKISSHWVTSMACRIGSRVWLAAWPSG
jgi:hypothetical protein